MFKFLTCKIIFSNSLKFKKIDDPRKIHKFSKYRFPLFARQCFSFIFNPFHIIGKDFL